MHNRKNVNIANLVLSILTCPGHTLNMWWIIMQIKDHFTYYIWTIYFINRVFWSLSCPCSQWPEMVACITTAPELCEGVCVDKTGFMSPNCYFIHILLWSMIGQVSKATCMWINPVSTLQSSEEGSVLSFFLWELLKKISKRKQELRKKLQGNFKNNSLIIKIISNSECIIWLELNLKPKLY